MKTEKIKVDFEKTKKEQKKDGCIFAVYKKNSKDDYVLYESNANDNDDFDNIEVYALFNPDNNSIDYEILMSLNADFIFILHNNYNLKKEMSKETMGFKLFWSHFD